MYLFWSKYTYLHLKGALIGLALALPSNSKTGLERVSKDKPFSLISLVIRDEGKTFYNVDTRSMISTFEK